MYRFLIFMHKRTQTHGYGFKANPVLFALLADPSSTVSQGLCHFFLFISFNYAASQRRQTLVNIVFQRAVWCYARTSEKFCIYLER